MKRLEVQSAPKVGPQGLLCLVLLILVGSLGCRPSDDASSASGGDKQATASAAKHTHEGLPPQNPNQSKASPAEGDTASTVDASTLRYPVPQAAPQQLFEYIADLSRREPQGVTPDDLGADLRELMRSRLVAADRILSAGPIPEIELTAIETKLDALGALLVLDPDGAGTGFQPFVDRLLESSNERHRLLAQVAQLRAVVEQLGNGQLPEGQQEVTRRQQDLLASDSESPIVFWVSRYAGSVLEQLGDVDLARDIYARTGQVFRNHPERSVAGAAAEMVDQAAFLGLQSEAAAALEGDAAAVEQLASQMQSLMDNAADVSNTLGLAMQTASMFEFAGQLAPARQLYDQILAHYGQHEDPLLARSVQRSIQLAHRRLDLKGQQVVIEGVQHDGRRFDWNEYRGGPVLIDFWTSYQDPAALNEMREVYRQFFPRGLEVVSVNLDSIAGQRQQFLDANRLPWPVVVSADPNQQGLDNPVAERCGVESVPFRLLVDREGRVVDWNLVGDRLTERLTELTSAADSTVR